MYGCFCDRLYGIIVTRHVEDGGISSVKLAESFLRARRQDNTTNLNLTGIRIQHGWNYATGAGNTYTNQKTITFPTPFSGIPLVMATGAGFLDNTNPATYTDLQNWEKPTCGIGNVTSSNFVARCYAGGDQLPTTRRVGFTWIAIGPA